MQHTACAAANPASSTQAFGGVIETWADERRGIGELTLQRAPKMRDAFIELAV